MKNFRIAVLILLVAIATPFALHRRAWALHMFAANGTAGQASLHILSPAAGEKLGQKYVVVQYENSSPNSAGDLNYELRLDARDPVHTKDTTYTFNGLTPGEHNLVVQAVDASGTPVSGTRSEVQFTVAAVAASTQTSAAAAPNIPTLPQPMANDLPNGNGSLPLLSIIGFGILVGGVISALRTRPVHK